VANVSEEAIYNRRRRLGDFWANEVRWPDAA
jgi:hypothetical protein